MSDDISARRANLGGHRIDLVLWLSVSALLGVATILGVVLASNATGFGFTASIVTIGCGVVIVVALGIRLLRWRGMSESRRSTTQRGRALPILGATVGAVLIVGSVTAAAALRPTMHERYSSIEVVGDLAHTAGLSAVAGQQVRIDWALTSYGYRLADSTPVATVDVNGHPLDNFVIEAQPPTQQVPGGGESGQTGDVRFAAPAAAGLCYVRLHVRPLAATGAALPDPDVLVLPLRITTPS